jgi:hypothetical protein
LVAFNEAREEPWLPKNVAGIFQYYRDFLQWHEKELTGDFNPSSLIAWTFSDHFHRKIEARSIFRMRNGMLGLGPQVLEVDDVVVFIFDGVVPYILRPVDGF